MKLAATFRGRDSLQTVDSSSRSRPERFIFRHPLVYIYCSRYWHECISIASLFLVKAPSVFVYVLSFVCVSLTNTHTQPVYCLCVSVSWLNGAFAADRWSLTLRCGRMVIVWKSAFQLQLTPIMPKCVFVCLQLCVCPNGLSVPKWPTAQFNQCLTPLNPTGAELVSSGISLIHVCSDSSPQVNWPPQAAV